MTYFLQTQRLGLRALIEEDADGPYLAWLNDEETCAGNSHHIYPYSRNQAIDYIRSVRSDKSSLVLAIIMKSEERHIGNVSLQHIHPVNRSAELAVLIGDKSCRGKGIGEEACRMIVAHGIKALNLRRVTCGTFVANEAMQKVALRLGMKEEGRRREAVYKDGLWQDVIEFGLLRSDLEHGELSPTSNK